jgi:hypothetical protein
MNLREHLESLKNNASNASNLPSNGLSSQSDGNIQVIEDEAVLTEYIASQMLESSLHYMYGCYFSYCKLLSKKDESAKVLMDILNNIPESIDTDEERRHYFNSLNNSVGDFLIWYLLDN